MAVWQNQSLTNEQPQADININQEENIAQNKENQPINEPQADKYEAVRQAAKERHAKRTESEQDDIEMRWHERQIRNEAQKRLSQELGIPIGRPMNHEQADQRRANPHFRVNEYYKQNCQTCVVAYEMRRRGLDVSALPNVDGSNSSRLSISTRLAWKDISGHKPKFIYNSAGKDISLEKLMTVIGQAMYSKGRYTIELDWKVLVSGENCWDCSNS